MLFDLLLHLLFKLIDRLVIQIGTHYLAIYYTPQCALQHVHATCRLDNVCRSPYLICLRLDLSVWMDFFGDPSYAHVCLDYSLLCVARADLDR